MSKRTKKVGTTGWMGPRYGIRIRRRVQDIDRARRVKFSCPKCSTPTVRRVASGLYRCPRCSTTFASDAYIFRPAPSIFRTEKAAEPTSEKEAAGEGKG